MKQVEFTVKFSDNLSSQAVENALEKIYDALSKLNEQGLIEDYWQSSSTGIVDVSEERDQAATLAAMNQYLVDNERQRVLASCDYHGTTKDRCRCE